jgi:hypothetical protein
MGIISSLGDKVHSQGTTSPLGVKVSPWGEVKNGTSDSPDFGGAQSSTRMLSSFLTEVCSVGADSFWSRAWLPDPDVFDFLSRRWTSSLKKTIEWEGSNPGEANGAGSSSRLLSCRKQSDKMETKIKNDRGRWDAELPDFSRSKQTKTEKIYQLPQTKPINFWKN